MFKLAYHQLKRTIRSNLVKGSKAEDVSATKKDILDSLILAYKLSLGVDKTSFYRKIIGRGGEKDQRLSKEHGVIIHWSEEDGKAYISGMKESVEAARDAIVSMFGKRQKIGGISYS